VGKAGWPVLGCCARHGERACPSCFDLAVAQADVEAVIDLLRGAELTGVVPFGEARATERHFRLFRPRVFTLRCVVGEVAEVSSHARELAERFDARLTAAGSDHVRAFFGPRPSSTPLTQGET
jgi:hypothetical protein